MGKRAGPPPTLCALMTDGRRWLAIDADMFGKPFIEDLHREFGPGGICVWIAFLCACKRSRTPGQIRFLSDADAQAQLGLHGWEFADLDGKGWTLDEFWTFTGRKKQTRRTSRGREMNVRATHWERWQDSARTSRQAERMRWSRNEKRAQSVQGHAHNGRTNVRLDLDLDKDHDLDSANALRAENQSQNLRAAASALRDIMATHKRQGSATDEAS